LDLSQSFSDESASSSHSKRREAGGGSQSFNPGVGILADGDDAVLVIDNGASVVRRVSFDGQSSVVVDGLSGSAVALGRAANGDLLVGTWGSGNIYRVAWPKS